MDTKQTERMLLMTVFVGNRKCRIELETSTHDAGPILNESVTTNQRTELKVSEMYILHCRPVRMILI